MDSSVSPKDEMCVSARVPSHTVCGPDVALCRRECCISRLEKIPSVFMYSKSVYSQKQHRSVLTTVPASVHHLALLTEETRVNWRLNIKFPGLMS